MVTLNRIYTKAGDDGKTALGDGSRVPKYALRVVAIGGIDEANAAIGLARVHTSAQMDAMLGRIQNDLFDVGADLCIPGEGPKAQGALRMTPAQTLRLENEIDGMNAELAPLSSFVLPGGEAAAAYLHLARTIVRRAERSIVELAQTERIGHDLLKYVNRLSDHLFVAARWINGQGAGDVLWTPGQNT